MSLSHHPNIVRNGLVFYSDPANSKSYPSSGSIIGIDLSNRKNSISYISGVSYSSANGGSVGFNPSGSYCSISNVLNVGPTSTFTLCTWAKWNTTPTAGAARRPAMAASVLANNFEFTLGFPYTYSSSKLGLEVGRAGIGSQIAYSVNSTPTGIWYHLAGVFMNGSGNFYLNGIYQSNVTYNATVNSATTTSGNWTLGVELYNGANSIGIMDGNVGPAMAYNRILSANEILQNYNATKARFGL